MSAETRHSHEYTPHLSVKKMRAKTIGRAVNRTPDGAGKDDLDWVLANPKLARKILLGHFYFFFAGAADDTNARSVYWYHDKFVLGVVPRSYSWGPEDRMVLVVQGPLQVISRDFRYYHR